MTILAVSIVRYRLRGTLDHGFESIKSNNDDILREANRKGRLMNIKNFFLKKSKKKSQDMRQKKTYHALPTFLQIIGLYLGELVLPFDGGLALP